MKGTFIKFCMVNDIIEATTALLRTVWDLEISHTSLASVISPPQMDVLKTRIFAAK